MSNNSFTIYMKAGEDQLVTGTRFYGLCYQISLDGQDGTTVNACGELVSGNPPSWFHGICSYTGTSDTTPTGILILTDRSEGVLTNATDYFSIKINDGSANLIGNDTWQDLDAVSDASLQGRYYADVDLTTVFKDAVDSGVTLKVEISVINDSEFDVATDVEGSIVKELTQPMGFERGTQLYKDLVRG